MTTTDQTDPITTCEFCDKGEYYYLTHEGKRLCEACYFRDFFSCTISGKVYPKDEAFFIEPYPTRRGVIRSHLKTRIHKSHKKKLSKKCGVSGKYFYHTAPISIARNSDGKRIMISPQSYRDCMRSNSILDCNGCGSIVYMDKPSNSIQGEISKILKKFPMDVTEYYFGGDNKSSCNNCLDRVFPLKFTGVPTIFSGPPTSLLDAPTPSGRTVGIEVECEPTKISQLKMFAWRRDETNASLVTGSQDSSLRGKYKVEYISPVLDALTMDSWYDEFSDRIDGIVYDKCGAHVHIGGKDLSWYDLMIAMKWCAINEPFIVNMVASTRLILKPDITGRPAYLPESWKTINCRSKSELFERLYGKGMDRDKMIKIKEHKRANDQNGPRYLGEIHRYYWLNVHSWWHRRTIEIRLHPGSLDLRVKMKNWSRYWMQVIDKVKKEGNKVLEYKPLELCDPAIAMYYRGRMKELKSKQVEMLGEWGKRARHPEGYRAGRMNRFRAHTVPAELTIDVDEHEEEREEEE